MKKSLTCTLCLLLLLGMLLGLTACAPKVDYTGTWSAEVDLSEMVAEAIKDEMEGLPIPEATLKLKLILTLAEDGTCEITYEARESLEKKIESYYKAIFPSLFEAIAEQSGMSLEEFEELAGASLDQLIEDAMKEIVPAVADELADYSEEETYTATAVGIVIGGSDTLVLKDGNLVGKIDAGEGMDATAELVFVKQP